MSVKHEINKTIQEAKDRIEREPASTCPWYWIMDYGKEKDEDNGSRLWNRWALDGLSDEQIKKHGLDNLKPLTK